MPKHIENVLICTVGGAPSVVTETVWALLERRPQWIPDAIHLVTTSVGARACIDTLKGPDSQLAALFQSRGKPFLDPKIVVPPDKSGNPIADIRTQTENIAFANCITQLIRDYTEKDGTRLHISIAGGRKTMSSYAQAAISIFGRDQDELTHVLVDPPEFEYCRGFFWPGQSPQNVTVSVRDSTTRETRQEQNQAQNATITLVPSPFIRMGFILSEDAFPGGKVEYEKVIEQVQLGLEEDRLVIHCDVNELQFGKTNRVKLAPQPFAFYRLLALARKEGWNGAGLDGIGADHAGWLTYGSFLETGDRSALELFKQYYIESAAVADRDDPMNAAQTKAKQSLLKISDDAAGKDAQTFLTNTFKRIKNDVKAPLEEGIPNLRKRDLAMIGEDQSYEKLAGKTGKFKIARFGLIPEPRQIRIRESD